MDKLVDTAVGLVEQGNVNGAITVMKEGIQVLESAYPNA